MMMDYRNGNGSLSIGVKRKDYCNRLFELDSRKPFRNKTKKFPEQEIDKDYQWLLDRIELENDKKTKGKRSKNVVEDVYYDYVNENVSDDGNGNDEDPHYRLFLANLVQDGKSYKLKVSKDDEPLRFLYYEQQESSDGFDDDDDDDDDDLPTYEEHANQFTQDMQIVQRDEQMLQGKVATVNEVSKNEKMNGDKSMNWDPCYLEFFKSCNLLKYGSFLYQGKEVNYEAKNDKQIVLAEKCDEKRDEHLSLKEKLMSILKKPFSKREYKDLKEYVEEQKPICRHMDLRDRSISSALEGKTKSLLDRSPECFRRRYESAKQERSKTKALNLLRMLCFWLEHVPNENIFEPWSDKEILEVLPLPRTR